MSTTIMHPLFGPFLCYGGAAHQFILYPIINHLSKATGDDSISFDILFHPYQQLYILLYIHHRKLGTPEIPPPSNLDF